MLTIKTFKDRGEPYKVTLTEEIPDKETSSFAYVFTERYLSPRSALKRSVVNSSETLFLLI